MTELNLAGGLLAPAEQRLEQGRLSRAVRADQRDVLATFEREGGAAQQLALADAHVDSFSLDHRAAAARRLQELESERARAA